MAICNGFVGVATSSYLRIYTYTGIQYHLLSLPGPVVSMTGFDNLLAVVFHSSNSPIGLYLLLLLLFI